MFDEKVEVNSNCVNTKIKEHIILCKANFSHFFI